MSNVIIPILFSSSISIKLGHNETPYLDLVMGRGIEYILASAFINFVNPSEYVILVPVFSFPFIYCISTSYGTEFALVELDFTKIIFLS